MAQWKKAEALLDKVDQARSSIETSHPSVILSSDGQVLYRASTEYREVIAKIKDVPKVVEDATLAAEDKRFRSHKGVDYWAMLRMLVTNAREGRMAQGGSTLTMQLAKRIASSSEKSFSRKLQDICLAIQIEHKLTKDQILLLYLNQVYYGSGAYGVKAAANVYLGKRLDQLTPSDAALLARMVRRPSKENAFDDLKTALRNRDAVLAVMRDEKMIDETQYEKALKEEPVLRRKRFGSGEVTFSAPYFVQYVKAVLAKEMPEVNLADGGYKVQTTLNLKLQQLAEKQVRDVVRANRRRRVTTAAFVLMDADGQLLAMVGGVDFRRNQYNVVTQGRRQPGSSFKPFVYAAGLSTGSIGPYDRISNARYYYEDGYGRRKEFHNSGSKYGGTRTVENAVANSVNVVAVRVLEKTGPDNVVEMAHSAFGFRSKLDPYLSLALGASEVSPLEMAQAYSVFMLQGDRATPYAIKSVTAPDGTTIKAYEPNIASHVVRRDVCADMDRFLKAVVDYGTARAFKRAMPPNSRGKTGTTSENKDAWFCGYTDNLVGIGWVGNERFDAAHKRWVYDAMSSDTFGGTVTIRIWTGVMKEAEKLVGFGLVRSGSDRKSDRKKEAETDSVPAPNDGAAPIDTPTTDVDTTPDGETTDPPAGGEVGPRETGETEPAVSPSTVDNPTLREPKPPAIPPQSSPGKRVNPPPAKKTPNETVEVEVCADSGERASIYCPETVRKKFRKGKAPRGRCRLHSPGN